MIRMNKSKEEKLNLLYKNLKINFKSFPMAKSPEDIIFGEGFVDSEILFIGEAPGIQETLESRPFIGRSGKLFRKTLFDEANILDSSIFITNLVKVRPPENRDPNREEVAGFAKILDQEIMILKPKLIVTLGRFSMAKFLPGVKISQVHGKLYETKFPVSEKNLGNLTSIPSDFDKVFVLPMYHPAAALRSKKVKQLFENDFRKIPTFLRKISKYLG